MASQPPFKASDTKNTKLDPATEMLFRQWVVANHVPFNPNAGVSDYDMRGYWQALQRGQPMAKGTEVNPNDGQPHYTDYYKTPLHHTFSQESQWGGPNDPAWVNDHLLANPTGSVAWDEKQPVTPDQRFQAILKMLR